MLAAPPHCIPLLAAAVMTRTANRRVLNANPAVLGLIPGLLHKLSQQLICSPVGRTEIFEASPPSHLSVGSKSLSPVTCHGSEQPNPSELTQSLYTPSLASARRILCQKVDKHFYLHTFSSVPVERCHGKNSSPALSDSFMLSPIIGRYKYIP